MLPGVALIDSFFWISFPIAFILLLFAISYYSLYINQYKKLTDTYTEDKYYLKIFSFWGICAFNTLFISCFAFIGLIVDRLSPYALFNDVSYREVLLYLGQTAVNGAFFGFLDTFNINLCKLQSGACKIDPGIYASMYAYAIAVTVDITFLTAVKDELCSWRDTVIKVIDLLKANQPEETRITAEEIKVNQMILDLISAGNLDVPHNEKMLVKTLKHSKVKRARSVYLEIMQSTSDMVIFQSCLTYFKENDDSRFNRVCKKIKHPRKTALIERFEFQRVRKKNKRR